MNSGCTCLFHKGFCRVYFGDKEKNAVTSPYSAHRKYAFFWWVGGVSKSKNVAPRKKVPFKSLHHILGHRYTR